MKKSKKYEWKTVEQLVQEVEFLIASNAPQNIIEKTAVELGAARIRDAIEQEVIDTFTSEV
jgi:hypothetical protein